MFLTATSLLRSSPPPYPSNLKVFINKQAKNLIQQQNAPNIDCIIQNEKENKNKNTTVDGVHYLSVNCS